MLERCFSLSQLPLSSLHYDMQLLSVKTKFTFVQINVRLFFTKHLNLNSIFANENIGLYCKISCNPTINDSDSLSTCNCRRILICTSGC